MNGGERIAELLERQGVRFVFTLCGGHISPILVGAGRRGLRVVDVRHEATAVFAADAVARLTGVPGVAAVTAGPGLTNTVTAVKNAQLAQSPVVVLGGATATVLRGRGALQDIDQRALMAPNVKRVLTPRRVQELVPALEQAFLEARSGVPGPVFVECPVDLLYDADTVRGWYGAKADGPARGLAERAQRWYLRRHVERLFAGEDVATPGPPPELEPGAADPRDVAEAARLLRGAERPVLLVGSQALLSTGRAAELARALEAIGAPAYLSGMARGLLGARHPLQYRHKRKEALREADVVVLAGTPCDFRLDYGRHIARGASIVAVNRAADELARNRRPKLGVEAAPETFLCQLAPLLSGTSPRWSAWHERLRQREAEREREIAGQTSSSAQGVDPIALCQAIDAALPEDSVLVADGGDFVATASYVLRPRQPLSWLDPGVFGTLGVGAGFALGARLCRPDAEVWILYGDGAAGYSLIEMDTFARHGLGVIALVGNDAGWSQIARDQVEILKDDVGTVLARTDYERAAEGLGAAGRRIERLSDVASALREAQELARGGRPVLVNAWLARSEFRKGSLSV